MTILSKLTVPNVGFPLGESVKVNNDVFKTDINDNDKELLRVDVNTLATLHRAIMKGKTKKVYNYLSQKNKWKKINKQDADGRSALHFICMSRNVELLRLLLNIDTVQLEVKDYEGKTPLYKAVESNCIDCITELISNGASLNTYDGKGNSLLHHIAQNFENDAKDILTYLVEECKMNLNTKNDQGLTPLHLAISNGHNDVVQILAENQADLNLVDIMNRAPIDIALKSQNSSIVEILRYFGASEERHVITDETREPNEVELLEKKLNELLNKRNKLISDKQQVDDENLTLQEQIREQYNRNHPKKRRNIVHGITKKSSRLLAKYVPKQSFKHLNERERKEESSKLQEKYFELETEYDNALLTFHDLEEKLLYETHRLEQVMTSQKVISNGIIIELKEAKEKQKFEEENITKLNLALAELQAKLNETKRKIDTFKEKSRDNIKKLKSEILELKDAIKEKDDQLEKFKNGGRLDELREEIEVKKREIEKGKVFENKLLQKLTMLKSRYDETVNKANHVEITL